MGLDSGLREISGMLSGLTYDDPHSQHSNLSSFILEEPPPFYTPGMFGVSTSTTSNPTWSQNPEDCEIISNIAIDYISRIMEEDIDEKVSHYQEESAVLRAAAKPFYDILGQKYPSSPDSGSTGVVSLPVPIYSLESPHESSNSSCYQPVSDRLSQAPFSSTSGSGSDFTESFEEPLITSMRVPEFLIESLPAWNFRRGAEEAQKFLPASEKLVIDLEKAVGGVASLQETQTVGEGEKEIMISFGSRIRKNPNQNGHDLDLMEGRSNKQSALFADEPPRSDIFDMVLLNCTAKKAADLRERMKQETSKASQNGQAKSLSSTKSKGKRQTKKEVVDLRTLLIHCAQSVATNDRRSTSELLKQIRQHSSPNGDGSQRLAYCFADGLEARLAGTGSQLYKQLVAKRTTATDMLKAYHLYLAACPFKKVSHFFSNQTILNVAEKASRVHIIDFGIYFGFQWPSLIQRLSHREGGPPMLRITGIDVPQPGFRPTERIEETGRRLEDYAKMFNVPFVYQGIAQKWDTIRVEDLNIDKDEVVIVNCLYRFRNLIDETVAVDSPRNRVLKTIREMNPDVFIHGIVNGSYSVPFFVTRFREALFHFSALFDMLETTVPRENEQRLLIERDLFGREALNVIACEGSERVERPETYKQWQMRNLRAGFVQIPLNPDIMKKAKEKVKAIYHKDFVIDEESHWLLQGWKGRIIYAVSTWKPNRF
ncbi:scarecrow-like protein 9 [Carex littledalei]|uniref:Scarecrow-like protein 9 n=1 Tax=Carex littledalei TaxID=544730 RepID=A0A833VAY3_9POAL|nr:scarecrow-like protein 9 [Carex littledalei]